MDIFIRNYKDLHTYAGNLLYRMPWLITKGYKAEDIVHDAYLAYVHYKEKFVDYEEKKLEQVIRNLVFWTLKDLNRSMRETNVDNFILDTSHNDSLVEPKLFNQELSKAVNALDKTEAAMFNMRLAGYTYKEINDKFKISNSQSILDGSISKVVTSLGIESKRQEDSNKLLAYVKKGMSISRISRETGISSYIVTRKLKSLLGTGYRDYSKKMQKKKGGF
jgi:DNA-directed RNA polymerase specialized sigma24 family protein